jgi:hypothetical protein
MPEFQDMLKSEQAAQLMKDSKKLERLRDAPETQRLFQLLSQNAGGNLEQAAGQAASGDTTKLMDAIQRLMQDPEGQKLLQQMKRSIK